jgi:PAS domain S-box-containing protein
MDPAQLPAHDNFLGKLQLDQKRLEYDEVLAVVNFFVKKTLDLMKGIPILIVITDENAAILEMAGDETIKSTINRLGIKDGLIFEEDLTGTNCATLALKHRHPIELIGKNHYHEFLHTSACYSVPFQYTDVKHLLGTISIMTAIELQHPTLLTMLCTVADSIERELLLRKQNRRLHILNQIMIDSTRNGIIVTDTDGNVTECNEFAQKLIGLEKEEILENNVHKLEAVGGLIYEVIQNGKEIQNKEIIFQHEDELRTICLFDALPIYDENAVLVGAFGQFRDITESFEAKEQAEKANNAKSEFLSSMSHELRTPLNAILGFAQLLEFAVSASLEEDVREILKAGRHLHELINEILDLSRIESKKMQVTLASVDVISLLEECLSLVQPITVDKQIGLVCDVYPKNVQVNADRTRLKQVVINLLTNAIKYNVDGGSVKVTSEIKGKGSLRINVVDTGSGMSEADFPQIFQPFHRLPQHGAIEGTGIGLTITKQLVELMGGNIGVHSEPGKGSHFWVDLNLFDNQLEAEAATENQTKIDVEEKSYKVLYVEDNPANLKLVTRIFNAHKHIHLLSAPNALEGIKAATSQRPDLILMDINLPDMSGFEAFIHLKKLEEARDIPVIAISANAMPADIAKGMELGFVKYITKPLNVPSFIEDINQALGINDQIAI